jgi:hypothetical protein
MSTIAADVPLISVPFVDARTGLINEAWFMFLVQLFRRTGGTSGGSSLTLADVLSLEDTFAPVSQVVGPNALAGEAIFGMIGPKDSMSEMIFAPTVSASTGGSVADQTFSSGTDFTPGTTTTLTLGNSFANAQQLWVFFDAAFQGDDQYSLNGTTLTFTSAIPIGTSKVYVKGMR